MRSTFPAFFHFLLMTVPQTGSLHIISEGPMLDKAEPPRVAWWTRPANLWLIPTGRSAASLWRRLCREVWHPRVLPLPPPPSADLEASVRTLPKSFQIEKKDESSLA